MLPEKTNKLRKIKKTAAQLRAEKLRKNAEKAAAQRKKRAQLKELKLKQQLMAKQRAEQK